MDPMTRKFDWWQELSRSLDSSIFGTPSASVLAVFCKNIQSCFKHTFNNEYKLIIRVYGRRTCRHGVHWVPGSKSQSCISCDPRKCFYALKMNIRIDLTGHSIWQSIKTGWIIEKEKGTRNGLSYHGSIKWPIK